MTFTADKDWRRVLLLPVAFVVVPAYRSSSPIEWTNKKHRSIVVGTCASLACGIFSVVLESAQLYILYYYLVKAEGTPYDAYKKKER